MIKAILFDLDRTLVNIDFPEKKALSYLHHNYIDPSISKKKFIHTYKIENEKWWLLRSQKKAGLEDVRINSFRDTLISLKTNIDISIKELSNYYIYEAQKHLKLYDSVIDMLKMLKKKTIKTAIITNGFSKVQRPKLKALDLLPYFDFICISDEVNLTKPNRGIFDLTLNKINVSNKNSLYVGDNIDDDYRGSVNADIRFLWFNEHKKENPENIPEFFSYNNFHQYITL